MESKIDYKSMCIRGGWFSIIEDCIMFAQKHYHKGKFQWFLNFISSNHFSRKRSLKRKSLRIVRFTKQGSGFQSICLYT